MSEHKVKGLEVIAQPMSQILGIGCSAVRVVTVTVDGQDGTARSLEQVVLVGETLHLETLLELAVVAESDMAFAQRILFQLMDSQTLTDTALLVATARTVEPPQTLAAVAAAAELLAMDTQAEQATSDAAVAAAAQQEQAILLEQVEQAAVAA
jgi:hypothetical protein